MGTTYSYDLLIGISYDPSDLFSEKEVAVGTIFCDCWTGPDTNKFCSECGKSPYTNSYHEATPKDWLVNLLPKELRDYSEWDYGFCKYELRELFAKEVVGIELHYTRGEALCILGRSLGSLDRCSEVGHQISLEKLEAERADLQAFCTARGIPGEVMLHFEPDWG